MLSFATRRPIGEAQDDASDESGEGDDIDLDQHVCREAGDLNGGTRRWVGGEVASVNIVHRGKVVHALEEHGSLDHLGQRTSGGGQNARDVQENALGLRRNVSNDQLLGSGIERDLAGQENQAVSLDGLGVGSNGFGSGAGGDDLTPESSERRWQSDCRI